MRRTAIFVSLLCIAPVSASAQAWLPPQGEGFVTLLYQNDIARLHSYSDGRTRDKGHTYIDGVVLDTDFSFTHKLAVRVSVPFLEAKYVGASPHLLVRGVPSTAVTLDNGDFHGGFQDLTFNVRYALSDRALKVVPFFQMTVPSNSYATLGHAAIGLNEREYRTGIDLGRRLNPILPKAFVQAQYAFGMSPLVAAHIAPRRSYAELQLGYLLTRHITLQGSSGLAYSHTGLAFNYDLFPNNLTVEQYLNHDRIARANLLDASGTAAYQVSRSTNFFVSFGHSFWGTNTHMRYLVTTIGFSKAFSTKLAAEKEAAYAILPEANKATTCTCAKK